jgi:signal transduction histidine kinase
MERRGIVPRHAPRMILRSLSPKLSMPRLLVGLVLLTAASALFAAEATRPVLTTAAQVRALTEEEARQGLSVRLRGVFMGDADPVGIAFVVQDETEGIYVQGPAELVAAARRGDLLEIEGVTDPGGFAPYVVAQSLRKIGERAIPEPIRVTLDQVNAGQMDAKWVEISGIVRSVEPKAPSDNAPPPPGTRYVAPSLDGSLKQPPKTKMKLASGSTRVVVEVNGEFSAEEYVDAEVRLRGLCFNLHNRSRQFVRPFIQVPRDVEVVVISPPPKKPFASEPRPVTSLLRFAQLTGKQGHRVHIRGVVLHHEPGTALWVRDEERSLRVHTAQEETLRPGDEVDVLGFPALGNYSAVLEDAVYQKRSTQAEPVPSVIADVSSALMRDGDLVQLDARVLEVRRFHDSVALTLDWHRSSVRAQMRLPGEAPTPVDWLPGSTVRISGVCSIVTDESVPLGGLWEPRAFQLLLRSPADLIVLESPPWWSTQRVIWLLSSFLALAVVAVAVVMLASRRRLRDQERRRAMAEAEFAAILNERNRVAREIHDTLAQSLGAISVQLELARTHAAEFSAGAKNHLATAHKLAREALAEARESIWNMRSQVLEKGDLGEALEDILQQLTEGTGVASHMRVEGPRHRLPPVVENNLLRIGQEAITNACKHANPGCIEVTLQFSARTVRLDVTDDGVGFVAGTQPAGRRRGFGLVGMKERVELLGGTIEVASAPGQGTHITVVVSV